jgi:NitT/TauT family transport system substrate-binding protein
MGLVNNSTLGRNKLRREYVQAGAAVVALVAFSLFFGPTPQVFGASGAKPEIRLAYMPNLTHAPAVIGVANRTFATSLPGYELSTKVVNAGPEAMEALVAGAVDVAYVGPSPALNTYVKTHGKAMKIIAGVCEGGAALVCRGDLSIQSVSDLAGRRVAVPEFGGTQDVSLRHFMRLANLEPREAGGSVEILPIKNPEILALFKQKQIDAAWVPEPWASRLAVEAGAKIVAVESDLWPSHQFSTTVMVASTKFMKAHPDAVATLIADNAKVIDWIGRNSEQAKVDANKAIGKLTGKPLKAAIVDQAWPRLRFSSDQDRTSLKAFELAAQDAGYVERQPNLELGIWLEDSEAPKKILTLAAK